jgi:hypothetical protein
MSVWIEPQRQRGLANERPLTCDQRLLVESASIQMPPLSKSD